MLRVILGVLCVASVVQAEPLRLVSDGRSDYVIVLPPEPRPAESRGAAELQSHLRQISDAELPIKAAGDPIPEQAIVLRRTEGLGAESFRLTTQGQQVIIAASAPRGMLYGCDTLLEKLGVRWFTPKVARIPALRTIDLPQLDESHAPAFEYREPFFFEAFDKDWASRLKINGTHAALDESVGGKVSYFHFVHTFDELVPVKLFETHPEYFPLIKGQRTGGYVQRCLSNPDVLKLSIERVRRWIERRPDAMIYSVSQNDTGKWCECDECKRITDQYGGRHSGLYLWFVNQVAEAIEADHPDKLIDTLAYQFTEAPPTGIVPRKNVRVRLCPIACCEAHPYESCTAQPNVAFMRHLRKWGQLTDTLYIWHYNTNFANYLMPFPDFDEFPAEVRLYQRSGVKGIFFQGAYAPGGGGSDSELRAYVMAKLLWDPKLDSDALVNEWMAGVYGAAAKPMRAWFDLLHEKVREPDKHFFIYDPPTAHYLSDEVLGAGDKLFDEAAVLAAPDAVAAEYVAKARLGLRYVKLMRQPTAGDEFTQFMADVRKFGITQLREGQPLDVWEKAYLEKPKK